MVDCGVVRTLTLVRSFGCAEFVRGDDKGERKKLKGFPVKPSPLLSVENLTRQDSEFRVDIFGESMVKL